jgi:hypothetical protein
VSKAVLTTRLRVCNPGRRSGTNAGGGANDPGSVAPANQASVRVLEKNGFRLLRAELRSLVFELD